MVVKTARHRFDVLESRVTELHGYDVPEIIADCARLRSRTGWRAEIPLEHSLRDILDYWRKRVRGAR